MWSKFERDTSTYVEPTFSYIGPEGLINNDSHTHTYTSKKRQGFYTNITTTNTNSHMGSDNSCIKVTNYLY